MNFNQHDHTVRAIGKLDMGSQSSKERANLGSRKLNHIIPKQASIDTIIARGGLQYLIALPHGLSSGSHEGLVPTIRPYQQSKLKLYLEDEARRE